MKRNSTRLLTVAVLAGLVSGCVTHDPQRVYTGGSDDSQLVFRSVNMPMTVEFGLSSKPNGCDGFEKVGLVRDSGRGVLLPWIAKLTEKASRIPVSVEASIPSDQVVRVKGYGFWDRGHCGPIIGKFIAGHARSYAVDFVWTGTSACELRVTDVTVLSEVKAVQMERSFCPRPSSPF